MLGDAPDSGGSQPPTDSQVSVQVPISIDVFISYASQDAAVANAIVAALERQGLKCWIAPRDVIPGSLYADGIVRAITEANVFALVLSEYSIASSHVGKEIERASSNRLPIIALRTDLAPLTPAFQYFLSESQWITVGVGGMNAAAARLAEAARRHLTRPTVAQKALPERHTLASRSATSRRRWIVAATATIVAVAVAGLFANKFWLSKHGASGRTVAAVAPAAAPAAAAIPDKSVAVLPFVDMSEQRDQEYFSDGLSEELIALLTKVPDLRVPARTSSFYFKGKQATIAEIAKALNVAHVLEGSVRKSGHTLRITAQLIRVDSGYHVWSETYDRPLTDVFKIQDEIAGAVVQLLKLSILNHYVPEAVPTSNIEAYTLYLRALSQLGGNGVADYDAAAEQLHSALILDPRFAAAWADLALVTIWKFDLRGSPTQAACADAHSFADHAFELNRTLVETHRAKGTVLQTCDKNLPAAEAEFRRALELQPRSSDALRSYAWLAQEDGRPDEALRLAQRAVVLDPLNGWNHAVLGDAFRASGRFAEAEMAYRKAVELSPTSASLHAILANILLLTHKPTEAVAEAEREPDTEWRTMVLPFALDAAGRKSDADRAIAEYELKYADDTGGIAAFYACRHDADRAIRWLSSFAAKHEGEYHDFPNREACFKNVESDTRYQALQRQMKAENPKPTTH